MVEDLAATCNQLAVMKKGKFLYAGSMRELLEQSRGHIWTCKANDDYFSGAENKIKIVSTGPLIMSTKGTKTILGEKVLKA